MEGKRPLGRNTPINYYHFSYSLIEGVGAFAERIPRKYRCIMPDDHQRRGRRYRTSIQSLETFVELVITNVRYHVRTLLFSTSLEVHGSSADAVRNEVDACCQYWMCVNVFDMSIICIWSRAMVQRSRAKKSPTCSRRSSFADRQSLLKAKNSHSICGEHIFCHVKHTTISPL